MYRQWDLDPEWKYDKKWHDEWSLMGEEELGEANVRWGMAAGWLTLQKAIMNDHWADCRKDQSWDGEYVDMVMSKLYYCWVRMLHEEHPEIFEEE